MSIARHIRLTLGKVLTSIIIGLGIIACAGILGTLGNQEGALSDWSERFRAVGTRLETDSEKAQLLARQFLAAADLDRITSGALPDETALQELFHRLSGALGLSGQAAALLDLPSGPLFVGDSALRGLIPAVFQTTSEPERMQLITTDSRRMVSTTPVVKHPQDPELKVRVILDETEALRRLETLANSPLRLESKEDGAVLLKTPSTNPLSATFKLPIVTGIRQLDLSIPVAKYMSHTQRSARHTAFFSVAVMIISVLAGLYGLHRLVLLPLHQVKQQVGRRSLPASTTDATEQLIAGTPKSLSALCDLCDTLQGLAITDPLTGLYNRVLFQDRLHQLITDGQREPRCAAILITDMNRFKQVNDTLGHPVGDELLRQVAQRMSHALRESDTLARLGGDEFAVLLPGVQGHDLRRIVAKLRRAIAAEFRIQGHTLTTSLSIGASLFPDDARDAVSLMQFADIALYQAKQSREAFELYTEDENHAIHRERATVQELSQAINQGQLRLMFQPVLDSRTRGIHYLEALIRFPHPTLKRLPVEQVVALAERNGLIRSLTNWVLEHGCRQLTQWRRHFPELQLGINLSMIDLEDPGLSFVLRRTLERHQLPPSALLLEIAEVALLKDTDRAVANLKRLADTGLELAIDDFGTGQASLRHLKRLPVQIIKIDRSFVMDMMHDADDEKIVRATIELAHELKLGVCAEGVDEHPVYDELISLGCNSLQGFFISRPLDAHRVLPWLKTGTERFLAQTNLELRL